MSIFIDNMKYSNRNKIFFDKTKEIYRDIELNNKVKQIIENDELNVNIYYKFKEKKRELNIYKEGLKEKQLDFLDSFTFKENNERGKLCKTIEIFTKNFPNLNKCVSSENQQECENEISIFELQKQIDLPRKLKIFFNIVNDHLKVIIKNEKELNLVNNKVYDYVMSKIFHKIYPKKRNIFDDKILEKSYQLSWIEPQNIINKETNYDFELALPNINKYFDLIRSEKSPRKKLLNLENIFSSINNLLIFSSGPTKIGVDDQMPILTYCFIKTRPIGIYTDCNFMKLYIGDKKNKGEDNQLSQILGVCDFVNNSSFNNFYKVDKEEFNQKCQISVQDFNKNYYEK